MKTITNLIFIALLFITASLSAQEHGPVLGGSLGTLHEKVSVVSSNFEGYKLHYHICLSLKKTGRYTPVLVHQLHLHQNG